MVGWMRLISWSCSLLNHSLEYSDPTVLLQFGQEMCLLDRQFSHLGSPNRRGLSLNLGSIGCRLPDQTYAPSEWFPDSLSQMALPLPLTLVWLPQSIVPVPWGPQPHSSSPKKTQLPTVEGSGPHVDSISTEAQYQIWKWESRPSSLSGSLKASDPSGIVAGLMPNTFTVQFDTANICWHNESLTVCEAQRGIRLEFCSPKYLQGYDVKTWH